MMRVEFKETLLKPRAGSSVEERDNAIEVNLVTWTGRPRLVQELYFGREVGNATGIVPNDGAKRSRKAWLPAEQPPVVFGLIEQELECPRARIRRPAPQGIHVVSG